MTLAQSLKLCQRRRPIVDPIPAFLDQLAAFERECRSLGYLTADEVGTVKNGSETVENGDTACIGTGGKKRKADCVDVKDGEKKKAIIGPVINPSSPLKGPGKSAAIGPARGPLNRK